MCERARGSGKRSQQRGQRRSEKAPGADSFSLYSPEARRRRKQWSNEQRGEVEELVECTCCGTFVPAGRTLTGAGGAPFCSDDCRSQVTDGR